MATFHFENKRALVTGAGKGIGRDVVIALVAAGATVTAVSRTEADLTLLKQQFPAIRTVCVNIADAAQVQAALQNVGPIDLLVNCAGVAMNEPFLSTTLERFDATLDTNVRAAFVVSQLVARGMVERKTGGSIVNVSSVASTLALVDHTSYCVSKGALDQLTRMMALELGPHKIRTNSVNPTVVMTEMGRANWSDPAKAGPVLARIPLGKFPEVPHVVNAILYFLSDASDMINGTFLPIDGGLLID
ncbi:dicarbonyl/L-xylulose reductase [Capsaspora owczarzaki ATCC 30864]|uniref:Dicarbonyl/L-xylulose reductase n=1 Tax=Capsaspora owczarzaki (strain ATCC 30864) TaxID=595528 RepID=A0A0D2X0P2_CAPO3|nr:dicarbonyl/L-xylulose reductase [Capsaspora owczarzaki ATCC 30864]KJE89404.1 dicarbonyl/L-xylulose reductase [Capsaspora owczarzaki ATCC 30864]|eukprot:XP_004365752.1 dicarbonyl/L-xylulose reductase [Capsaspora owczarzaki ATCC 30864]